MLRDPRYVASAEHWAQDIEEKCRTKVCERLHLSPDTFSIELRLMGLNASFGALERRDGDPVEIGVIGIVTAPTEVLSEEISKILNPYLLHHPLTQEEEQPTFAFLFSPPEMKQGQVYEFALNHVLSLNDPMEAFRLEVIDIV